MADSPIQTTRPTRRLPDPQRRLIKRLIVVAVYLLLVGADVALSHWDKLFGRERCDLVTARNWYQRLVTLGYRKPKPHFVSVVTVNPPEDACEYRLRLAELVRRIGELQPTMIVLDYSFSPRSRCAEATKNLQQSIDEVGQRAGVVFGIRSSTLQEVEDNEKSELPSLKAAGFGSADQIIWPSDVVADGVHTITGVYRLDCDTRRIPVEWSVFEKTGGQWTRAKVPMSTIAFAAARFYDPALKNTQDLSGAENPFTSFISEDMFHPVDSEEILKEGANAQRLQRRIVLIGDAQREMHDTVVGRVPGVILQANYIESLLDERYFEGLGPIASTAAAFVCLLIIFAIFDRTPTPNRGLFRAGFFVLSLMFVSYVALVHFARLFTFWAPSLLSIGPAYVSKWQSLRSGGLVS